jgi:hypothetical protein
MQRTVKHDDPFAGGKELISFADLTAWEKEHRSAAARTVAQLGSDTTYLSLSGNVYKIGAMTLGTYFDFVICAHAPLRFYRPKAWKPGDDPSTPICWANAQIDADGMPNCDDDDLAPLSGVTEMQSDTCKGCKHSRFGSAPTGKGQACTANIRVASLIVGSELLGAFTTAQQALAVTMAIPPTGLGAFKQYMRALGETDCPFYSCITRISDSTEKNWSNTIFKPVGMVPTTFKDRAQALVETGPRLVTSSHWPLREVPTN